MKYLYPLPLLLLFAGCTPADELTDLAVSEAVPLEDIHAVIEGVGQTRAAALADKPGRYVFADGDHMVLTTMKRTPQANIAEIPQFSYSNLEYVYGNGWGRLTDKGSAGDGKSFDKVYWSDAINPHTYIGYSVPQGTFDWELRGDYYYGTLGAASDTKLDFSAGQDKICSEDLLITYHTDKTADISGKVAEITFHHALSLVRVIVNISGFSSGEGSDDEKAVVSDVELKDMLTQYRWKKEKTTFDYGHPWLMWGAEADPVDNPKKLDTKFWIPRPEGAGEGSNRTFTFYALAVPTVMAENTLRFSFNVTYPKAMNPNVNETKPYSAAVPTSVEFRPGHCTTLNISLNHRNEKMTVGAEYMDWEFVDTPDQGELYKNSTFMEEVARDSVTIADDQKVTVDGATKKVTEDDATWLYEKNGQILDIYGNDGTQAKPYTISTARQLLSFAYEVNNNRSFAGQFVKLDANITMQPKKLSNSIANGSSGYDDRDKISDDKLLAWPGIGDASHPFQGTFMGENRYVTLLHGSSLFGAIGANAKIELFGVASTVGSGVKTGSGLLADSNAGTINACYGIGTINSTVSTPVGGLVGSNSGTIYASYHQGTIIAAADKGGIAGTNSGTIQACYSAGGQYDSKTIADADNSTPPTSSYNNGGIASANTGTITGCYYSTTLVADNVSLPGVTGMTSGAMQKESFIGTPAIYYTQAEIDAAADEKKQALQQKSAAETDKENALDEKATAEEEANSYAELAGKTTDDVKTPQVGTAAILYTEETAAAENESHQVRDESDNLVFDDENNPVYPDGYTPVKAGDVQTPASDDYQPAVYYTQEEIDEARQKKEQAEAAAAAAAQTAIEAAARAAEAEAAAAAAAVIASKSTSDIKTPATGLIAALGADSPYEYIYIPASFPKVQKKFRSNP